MRCVRNPIFCWIYATMSCHMLLKIVGTISGCLMSIYHSFRALGHISASNRSCDVSTMELVLYVTVSDGMVGVIVLGRYSAYNHLTELGLMLHTSNIFYKSFQAPPKRITVYLLQLPPPSYFGSLINRCLTLVFNFKQSLVVIHCINTYTVMPKKPNRNRELRRLAIAGQCIYA